MIQAKNIAFGYKKQTDLFTNLNLDLECGNIVGLFGKNGAGKTTLLRLISGLLEPNKGVLRVDELSPFKRSPEFLNEVIFILEEMDVPSITIKRYIKLYAVFYKKFDFEKMNQILSEFELNENSNLGKISFGQKKKFMIAFALSTNCKYLFLDEPTNGLDIPSKSIFRKVLVNSIHDNQLVLISTHQVKDIETLIDRVLILDNGAIIFNQNIESISKTIQFKNMHTISDNDTILYKEKCIEGYKAILSVTDNEETKIDLELLFNAIVNNTKITF
jgi:ABC-2 type transport system ATP-binding protein